jgi:peptide chain release factor 2
MAIIIPAEDNELLEECKLEAFRSSGAGGQHVNKTDSAVRLTHIPTGIVTYSQSERSQYLNRKECLRKLRSKIKLLNYKKPKRIATKVPKSVKNKNHVKKKRESSKKSLRQKPSWD